MPNLPYCHVEVCVFRFLFYLRTPTGERHLEGIKEAYNKHEFREKVCLRYYPYANERQGVELLLSTIRGSDGKQDIDLVLGPTESGVFVQVHAQRARIDASPLPVISGLVTAPVGNEADGWYFRTNADVTHRTNAIHDFINKFWISSIAVVYADTEFGRRAERAFRKRITSRQRNRYLPLLYENPPDASDVVQQLLDTRPEAIGFFGEREDIEHIYPLLRRMNGQVTDYDPIFFTILDSRLSAKWVDDMYFVAVTGNNFDDGVVGPSDDDDVRALGHDTALLVLDKLQELGVDTLAVNDRKLFRDQFATLLSGSGPFEGTKTAMRFNNYKNNTPGQIFHLHGNRLSTENIVRTFGLGEKFRNKVQVVFASHGWWPVICIALIVFIAALVSWNDLREIFRGGRLKVLRSYYFYLFVSVHALISLMLYIGLAETGAIRYDSVITAMIIAISPSALLRTNVIETAQGKAIGLEHFYRQAISSVDRQLMMARYDSLQARVNIITYHNSLSVMRRALLNLYANHRSAKERARLFEQLTTALTNEEDYFERRRICARHLLHQMDWERLKAEGFVPHWLDKKNPIDPQLKIRAAAKFCEPHTDKVLNITQMMNDWDKPTIDRPYLSQDRIAQLKDFLDKEKKEVMNSEGELNVNIRFLLVLRGFNVARLLRDVGFSDEEVKVFERNLKQQIAQPITKTSIWSRIQRFFGREPTDDLSQDSGEPTEGTKQQQPPVGQQERAISQPTPEMPTTTTPTVVTTIPVTPTVATVEPAAVKSSDQTVQVAAQSTSNVVNEDPELAELKEGKTLWERKDATADNGAKSKKQPIALQKHETKKQPVKKKQPGKQKSK